MGLEGLSVTVPQLHAPRALPGNEAADSQLVKPSLLHVDIIISVKLQLTKMISLFQLQRIRRTLNSQGRRMSSTWTTTTSATGMPTLDADVTVSRPPVVTFSEHNNTSAATHANKSPQKSSLAEGALTSTKNGPQETYPKHRPACFSHSFPAQASPGLSRKLSPDLAPSGSPLLPRRSPDRGTASPVSSSPNMLRRSPDRMFATSNVFRRLSREETQLVKDALDQAENQEEKKSDESEEKSKQCKCDCHTHSSSTEQEKDTNQTRNDSAKEPDFAEENRVLPKSRELDKLLDQICDWNFPIFDACEHGNILTQVRKGRLCCRECI